MTHLLKSITLLLFLLGVPLQSKAQLANTQSVLTNYEDIIQQSGKEIKVFGEITRHYQLKNEPFVLLLPNQKWIFLNDFCFHKNHQLDTYRVIITGVVDSTHKDFRMNEYIGTNQPPNVFHYHTTLPNSEELIANQPYFSKIISVEPVYACDSLHNIQAKKGQWMYLYGNFHQERGKLSFSRRQKNTSLRFDLPILHDSLPTKGIGYFIIKFDSLEQALVPSECAVQYSLPICKTTADLDRYYGELVAIKVRKTRILFPLGIKYTFFKGSGTKFYPYSGGVPHVNRKVWVIDRIVKVYGSKPFYIPTNSSSVGNFILWDPAWIETR